MSTWSYYSLAPFSRRYAGSSSPASTLMPFTPFHLGAALIVKPASGSRFSLLTFAIAQIAMDIEPGVGMFLGSEVLHGPSHTVGGAFLIACIVALIAPRICDPLLRRFNRELIHYKQYWLLEPESLNRTAVLSGAFFGTFSHIVLDSLMHHDIHPLAPFSTANPLLDLVSHDGVYQLCTVLSVVGAVLWLVSKWARR